MRWSLRQIEIFLAVWEEGGFSAAGEKIGMVQPAISIAIRKLEEKAGAKLIDRSGGQIRLTHEGTIFLDHARMIRSGVRNLERQLRELRSLEAGQIIIGAPPLISEFVLPDLIGRFLEVHPGIHLSAVVDNSEAISARLIKGEIDIAVVAGAPPQDEADAVLLEQHPIVALTSVSSPIARLKSIDWPSLLDQPLILFPEGYHQRSIVEYEARRIGRRPNLVIESESARFISSMVRAGRGVSVTFEAISREFEDVAGIPISENPSIPVWICRRNKGTAGIAADALFVWATSQSKT